MDRLKIEEIGARVIALKAELEALDEMSESFPAIRANSRRALASLRMMEINLPLTEAGEK